MDQPNKDTPSFFAKSVSLYPASVSRPPRSSLCRPKKSGTSCNICQEALHSMEVCPIFQGGEGAFSPRSTLGSLASLMLGYKRWYLSITEYIFPCPLFFPLFQSPSVSTVPFGPLPVSCWGPEAKCHCLNFSEQFDAQR